MNVTLASVWERTRFATRGAWVVLALSACGQSATTGSAPSAAVTDTASAYLALSDKVEGCEDAKDVCVTDAAGDATKLAACDAAAESCIGETRDAQADARRRLRDDAEGCVRECRRNNSDADGGADEGGRMNNRGCFGRRAPVDSQCTDDFFVCLDATGVRQSGGTDQLDDATRVAVSACVDAAHTCMVGDMRGRRGGRGPGRHGGAAGEPATTDGGVDDRDGRGRGPGRRGAAGEPAATDGGVDDRDGRGPGRRGGAAGGDSDRRGRRGEAGAAGN